ncbi:MAG: DEAD/DEAH box helicase [Ornithinibacter sp.]
MPNNTSGPKKARWSTSQKAEARKAPKKAHHRGQPDGPRSAPKRAARSEGDVGAKRPRSERSPRWDREDPRRTDRSRATRRPDDRGDSSGSGYSRDSTQGSSTPSRGSSDRSEQRPVRRPHDERPRRERGDRPVRDQAPRVADPVRRDRHEGRHAERDAPRGGYRSDDRGGSRPDRGGYAGDRPRSDDRGSSRPDASRGGYRSDDRGGSHPVRGGYAGDRPRRDERADRFAPRGEDHQVTFEEAEAERAEADTWTAYSSAAGGAKDVTEDNGFAALGLPERLVERLARDGITEPFPIQVATIPDALAGRDVLGRARTGSGKTLAFGLTMIARLADGTRPESKRPRSLILVPTRELAMQVSDALEPFVHVTGLRHKLVAGGLSYEPQIKALNKGIDILVATPGRLADLMERGAVQLGGVQIAVLDEADHMADMGFLPEVTAILDEVPAGGQRLLFSATLDKGIDTLVDRYLVDPVTHSTDEAQASIDTMSHHVLLIDPQDKKALTAELAGRGGRVIVFARTQLGSDRIAGELRERGVLAAALHGGLSQAVRNRVLGAFRDGSMNVLVATDVAARGIHVDDVGMVVQVDPPTDHKDYLHRAGRTARAGEEGAVVMIALPHQRKMVTRLIEGAGAEATTAKVRPGDDVVLGLGGRAPSGVPVPDALWRPILEGGKNGGRRGGRPGGGGRPAGRPGGRPQGSGGGRPRQGSGRPGGYRGRMDG